jgi:predicted amidohydrolase
MKVGFFQFDPVFGQVERNLDRITSRSAQADCDLMVLPELCASGYQFTSKDEVRELAEPIPGGPTTTRLLDLARGCSMHIVAGLPERQGEVCYNSAVVVGPSGYVGTYRKSHLFFEETLYFHPGDTGFQVWNIGPAVIGVMVCFDWLYPESARTLALKGADLICHPSNLVLPHCPDAMVTRCLENRVFAVTANRIGSEARGGKDRLTYIGSSEIVAPDGKVLHRAARDEEALKVVVIDPADARRKTINPYNDLLRDRRPSLYRSSCNPCGA